MVVECKEVASCKVQWTKRNVVMEVVEEEENIIQRRPKSERKPDSESSKVKLR